MGELLHFSCKGFSGMFNNYFKYYLDAYFWFRMAVPPTSHLTMNLPAGHEVRIIQSIDDSDVPGLVALWQEAYYEPDQDHRSKAGEEVNRLLSSDNSCAVLQRAGKVVGMMWVATGDGIRQIEFARRVGALGQAAVSHHAYICPESRGMHLQNEIRKAELAFIRDNGIQTLHTFAGVKNLASVRNNLKLFHEYKLLYHLKFVLPFAEFNFFPGDSIENWRRCLTQS